MPSSFVPLLYGLAEPPFLTGFLGPEFADVQKFFAEVLDYVQPVIWDDAEMLYIVGLGAHLFEYIFPGGALVWIARSEKYRRRYRELCPNGIDPNVFLNRGYYGEYYFGQASVEAGY